MSKKDIERLKAEHEELDEQIRLLIYDFETCTGLKIKEINIAPSGHVYTTIQNPF